LHLFTNSLNPVPLIVAITLLAVAFLDGGAGPIAVGAIAAGAGLGLILAVLVLRAERLVVPRAAQLAAIALVGFAGLTALSLQWASNDGAGFADLVLALAYASVFILLVLLARPGSGPGLLRAIAFVGLTIGAVSLAARLFGLGSWDATISAVLPAAADRLGGPLGYWNALGSLAALTIPLLLWQATAARSLTARRGALVAIALPMAVIMLTASRGAVLAAVLGVGVCVGYSLDRRRTIGLAALAAAVGALFCGFVAVVDDGGNGAEGAAVSALASQRPGAELEVGLLRGADSGRGEFWAEALSAFGADPLRGVGAGGYADYWNRHNDLGVPIENAHSAPLEAIAELGILGGFLLLAFLVLVLRAGHGRAIEERIATVRERRGEIRPASVALAVVVAGLVGFLTDWTNEIPAAFLPVLLSAALLSGGAFLPPGHSPKGTPAGQRNVIARVAGVVLLAVAAVSAGLVLAVSAHSIRESRAALAEGRLTEAAGLARAGIELQPWAAEPRLLLAEIELEAGNLDAALRQSREAVRLAPDDFRVWRLSSLISNELRVKDAARAYAATAERLAPAVLDRADPDS